MSYDTDGKQITHDLLLKALNRLGDLLRDRKIRIDLVCCGGVVSVLYHRSRHMTHDVDALFPTVPKHAALLKSLIDKVGEELGLEHGPRDKWFNDGVSFIGLQTRSNTIVFNHPHLILRAAEWAEMLAHKIAAYRGERDINDAIHFLKEIDEKDPEIIFTEISRFKPFVPTVKDELFRERFMLVWKRAHE